MRAAGTGGVLGCCAIPNAAIARNVRRVNERIIKYIGHWLEQRQTFEMIENTMLFNPNPPHSVRSPIMYQSWNNISFLHWRYDTGSLQSRLPAGLDIDVFERSAWVSLTPFLLENVRAPFMPALPWLSRFPEMNLRTYVNGPAGPGIWFFALDADRLAAVLAARSSFGLPYHWSDMG